MCKKGERETCQEGRHTWMCLRWQVAVTTNPDETNNTNRLTRTKFSWTLGLKPLEAQFDINNKTLTVNVFHIRPCKIPPFQTIFNIIISHWNKIVILHIPELLFQDFWDETLSPSLFSTLHILITFVMFTMTKSPASHFRHIIVNQTRT